jgi:hypothetical protein
MHPAYTVSAGEAPSPELDEFDATARTLSRYRFKTIARLTAEQLPLRRAAFILRRRVRGPSKLARRMRRRNELGRAGSF